MSSFSEVFLIFLELKALELRINSNVKRLQHEIFYKYAQEGVHEEFFTLIRSQVPN